MKKFKKVLLALMVCVLSCGVIPNESVHAATNKPEITYAVHLEDNGWLDYVSNGNSAGTVGYFLRVEAIKIKLKNVSGSINYRTHVQNIGWTSWTKNNGVCGTTGKSLRVEAIEMKLSGNVSKSYDVYYRTHVQNTGWTSWVKNGQTSGSIGKSLRMETIQIQLVKKGATPSNKGDGGQQPRNVCFGQQVADYGCRFIGNPYKWGGTSLTNGCDCSGFVMSVYAHFGISLPHSSVAMRSCGYEVPTWDLKPGDIVCYSEQNGTSHVGIYIGRGQVVNAANSKQGICLKSYNYRPICNIRRMR